MNPSSPNSGREAWGEVGGEVGGEEESGAFISVHKSDELRDRFTYTQFF